MADETREPGKREPGGASSDGGVLSGAQFAGIGLQFGASIILFLYVGKWLDEKLGTSPWLLMAGVFLGAGAAFYSMYRKLMRSQGK